VLIKKRAKSLEVIRDIEGKVVASLFFEPSTRTRIQRERFSDPQEYEKLKGTYIIEITSIRPGKE